MTIQDSIKNFRDLKDEVLRLKKDMDYPMVIQIAEFCDSAISAFSKTEEIVGPSVEIASISHPLTLEEIASKEKQDEILQNHEKISSLKTLMYQAKNEVRFNSESLLDAKKKISEFLKDEKWPSQLFTPNEIYLMATRLNDGDSVEKELLDKINAAICKDFTQRQKIQQMKENAPVEKLAESFLKLDVLRDNREGSLNYWGIQEYKAVAELYPEIPAFWGQGNFGPSGTSLESAEKACLAAKYAGEKNEDARISDEDKLSVVHYSYFIMGNFSNIMEQNRRMKALIDEKFDAFTYPIVTFLQKAGMNEDKIIRVFEGMKRTAQKMLQKNNLLER